MWANVVTTPNADQQVSAHVPGVEQPRDAVADQSGDGEDG